jgi:uncharacterized protein (DUF1501 family)
MNSLARRRFLQALAAAPLAAGVPAIAAPAASPRLLVLVFLYGGNDGFNTWVPYTNALYYRLRPTLAVPRDAVIRITDHHGFHPSLAPLAPIWEARELALVQGVGYPEATQQHFRDIESAFTACDGEEFSSEGWVTRALKATSSPAGGPGLSSSAPLSSGNGRGSSLNLDAIAFDTLDIRESDPMGPFRGDKLAVVQMHYAHEWLAKRRMGDCVIEANTRGRERLRTAPPLAALPLRTAFPGDPFGQGMRAAVELAALDRSLPVIHVALNGLDGDKHHSVDCHWDQLKYHGDALKRLAEGLAALRSGLREIGRWDETLVATYDEFGRSPVENEDRGTHHGLGTTHFVMGGRVKGGLFGEPPPVERVHQVGGPAPSVDARRLWTSVVERWWGGDASRLFARRYAPLDLLKA